MKVNIGKEFYVVCWKKKQFRPKYGSRFDLELDETTCVIKTLEVGGNTEVVSTYTVRQNPCDQSDNVKARKLSFTGALKTLFEKAENRCVFWEEYKKTMRLTPRTWRTKYCELKSKFDKLQKENTKLEETATSVMDAYR